MKPMDLFLLYWHTIIYIYPINKLVVKDDFIRWGF